jgi:uncharacterized RDD family membrane protein YckC
MRAPTVLLVGGKSPPWMRHAAKRVTDRTVGSTVRVLPPSDSQRQSQVGGSSPHRAFHVNQETTMQTNHTGCDDSPTLGSRLAARAVDVAILAAVDVGLGQLMGFGFDWLALAALTVLVYFAGGDAAFGATPGKRLFGLRVLGPGGCRPTVRQALIRESFTLLGAVPFAGPVLALGAWVWIVLTIRSHPAGQGKHDILAGGTRVIGVRGAPAIGFVLSGFLTSVLLVQGALDARQRARIDQSVDLLVPSAPVVVDVAGTRHLIHELHITNMRPHALSVERLQVTTPASPASLVDLREATLKSAVARVGAPRDAPDPQIIGPGQRAVAYFWIPLRETAPTTVAHRLEIGVQGTPSTTPIVVESAPVTVLPTDPIALDPPLAGGPVDCDLRSGAHGRASHRHLHDRRQSQDSWSLCGRLDPGAVLAGRAEDRRVRPYAKRLWRPGARGGRCACSAGRG